MSYPLEGPLPVIDLNPHASITIAAVDPTVSGVVFSDGVIYGEGGGGGGGDLDSPQPHWLPVGPGGD
jgi:hypothetical protein